VLVEAAIALPVQLLITFAILQYCLIAVAEQIVTCAAHAAARASLVGMDPQRAAAMICSPIAGSYRPGGAAEPIVIPGWGVLRRSVQSQLKTFVVPPMPPEVPQSSNLRNLVPDPSPPDDGDKLVRVSVVHYFELAIPFVDFLPWEQRRDTTYWHPLWGNIVRLGPRGVLHKVILKTATLPQPWDGDLDDVRDEGHPIIPDLR